MTEECKEEFEGKETIALNADPNCITGAVKIFVLI